MYQNYYGFTEKPFAITPNPHFLFLSKTHKEVFAHLLYGIRQRSGFIELIGEVGTGKTTVLRTLMGQLTEENYRLALIFNPSLSAGELLRGINREFGLAAAATPAELLEDLNHFLLRENAAGRTVILVIDEAQNLEPAVLEQIRLLSNLETETTKLIQIVLVGQPELAELLARPDLRQLAQRITVRFHLQPMDFADSAAYIEHRLQVAGGHGRNIFTPAAVRRIYRWSGGLPRLINVLCDRALLVGYTENLREINPAQVTVAIRELRREDSAASRWWRHPLFFALIPLLIVAGGAGWLLGRQKAFLVPSPTTKAAMMPSSVSATQVSAPVASKLAVLHRKLAPQSEGESAITALNALLPLWHLQTLPIAGAASKIDLRQAGLSRNLQVTPIAGNGQLLCKFDTPLILALSFPEGARYLAVTGMNEKQVTVAPAPGDTSTFSWEELHPFWSGRGYLLWRNHLDIPPLATPGTANDGVARLQDLMRETGFYDGPGSRVYDETTMEGIRRFQATNGIAPDGEVGPQTLILLYRNSSHALSGMETADGEKK